jgi:hypothetical protein
LEAEAFRSQESFKGNSEIGQINDPASYRGMVRQQKHFDVQVLTFVISPIEHSYDIFAFPYSFHQLLDVLAGALLKFV